MSLIPINYKNKNLTFHHFKASITNVYFAPLVRYRKINTTRSFTLTPTHSLNHHTSISQSLSSRLAHAPNITLMIHSFVCLNKSKSNSPTSIHSSLPTRLVPSKLFFTFGSHLLILFFHMKKITIKDKRLCG